MASLFSLILLTLCLLLSSPLLSKANAKSKLSFTADLIHRDSPIFPKTNAKSKLGFTTDLIHRDSPKSPFYNPMETSYKRLRNAINRSLNRVYPSLNSSLTLPQAGLTSYGGEYLMNVALGTPPFPYMLLADTGSDLLWTQCKPCEKCFSQVALLFDPKTSSTYKDVSCFSRECSTLRRHVSCSNKYNKCSYSMSYGDKSYSKGFVATDTLTLGSVQLPNMIIGCGHNNDGIFNNQSSGIIGLGGGAASLIRQLGDSIEGKFSYCLVPRLDQTSKINFGTNADVSGPGTVTTPLVNKYPDTYYYLTLNSISVGGKQIQNPSAGDKKTQDSANGKGNIVIDSGATLIFLPNNFYSQVEGAVASSVTGEKRVDPSGVLSLCYTLNSQLKIPVITMHFDGADVKLNSYNSFVRVQFDVVCFAFKGTDGISIYGNLAQTNFLIGYDIVSKKVSFKPTECANM